MIELKVTVDAPDLSTPIVTIFQKPELRSNEAYDSHPR